MKFRLKFVSLLLTVALTPLGAHASEPAAESTAKPKRHTRLAAAQEHFDRQKKREARQKTANALKLVDINNADKAELKTLHGIGDAEAAQIIAGRPYGSKAWLVTHHVINGGIYAGISKKIVAGQPKDNPGFMKR